MINYKTKDIQVHYCPRSADSEDSNLHYCANYIDVPFMDNIVAWGETRIEALAKLQMFEEAQK